SCYFLFLISGTATTEIYTLSLHDALPIFTAHLEETQGQVERIDQIVELLDIKLKRMKCAAMEGLVEESKEVIDEIEKGPVRDARSEEHTSELQSREKLVCRLLLEKKNTDQ